MEKEDILVMINPYLIDAYNEKISNLISNIKILQDLITDENKDLNID